MASSRLRARTEFLIESNIKLLLIYLNSSKLFRTSEINFIKLGFLQQS